MQLTHDELFAMLADESPSVRIVAAEALGRYGGGADLPAVLEVLLLSADLSRRPLYEVVAALNAIDYLGETGRHRYTSTRPRSARPCEVCCASATSN